MHYIKTDHHFSSVGLFCQKALIIKEIVLVPADVRNKKIAEDFTLVRMPFIEQTGQVILKKYNNI